MRNENRSGGPCRSPLLKITGVLALAFVACSSAGGNGTTRSQAGPAVSTTVTEPPPIETTTTSTSTTEAPTTTTTAKPAALKSTTTSPQIKALQERLAELGYDVGTPDGAAGARTSYAIMAFQKVEGLSRDGVAGPQVQAALAKASKPEPMVPGGAPTRIEIDVARQVLFFWKNGALARILPVSTGSGEHYCVDGACDTAVTPGGSFKIGRKAEGLEVSPLGELWWPMYFNGGIAIHGSPSIPAYPASHGCIRIPMYAAPTFYDQIPGGTRVHVLNSPEAEAPPDAGKAVPNAAPPADPTPPPPVPETTTTLPPATIPETTTTTTVLPTTTSTTIRLLPVP